MTRLPKDGVYINPESGLKLTRAQRRQVKKNTERIDRTVSETDRRFFRRFPHRQFRLRLPGQAEIDQGDILQGSKLVPPPGFRFFVAVCNVAPGNRAKLLVPIRIGSEWDDVDLPESKVREIWELSSTPETRKIEQALRQISEGRT
jgi:hypothetical protein